jgi:hypothetical protein
MASTSLAGPTLLRLDRQIKGFPLDFDCQGFVAADLVLREK